MASLPKAEQTSQWLLNQEDCDCDDRRFYCSYLISHSSISLGDATDDANYFKIMEQSLIETLIGDKLTDQDRSGIHSLWREACLSAG